jgi:hypothetical protein
VSVRWLGAVLAAMALVACGGNGNQAPTDVPADLPDLGDVPVVQFDYGTDTPAADPGVRDETPADEGTLTPDVPQGEVAEETVDPGPCVPDCTDRNCGSDGCDDVCGYCQQGFLCTTEGVCAVFCVPQCDGKVCGPDGCQGYCGPGCAENEDCAPEGDKCLLKNCEKQCAGKACGPDSCGGDCGLCPEGNLCGLDGQCMVDTNCYAVTEVGRCVGNERQYCLNNVLTKETCDTAAGYVCGILANMFVCRKPEICQPQCAGKTCGPDGCTGTCGACTDLQVCSTNGQCGEACGLITGVGLCIDGCNLAICQLGTLTRKNCCGLPIPVACRQDPDQIDPAFTCI